MNPTLSIILPTYNESQNIIKIINTIHKVCKNISHEIIVVDDASPDGTYEKIKKFPSVRSFLHPGTRGLGLSILYGIKNSRGHIILGMDADGNHDPHVIPHLLSSLQKADLVVASRFILGGGMSDTKRFWASFLFNNMLQRVFGFPITDNTSGIYAIHKIKLMSLGLADIYYGYGEYHLRLVWKAKKAGLTITEVPVYYGKRLGGESKSSLLVMIPTYLKTALALRFTL